MCRTLTLTLVPAFLMVTLAQAHAQRSLQFPGRNTTGGSLTVYIGAQSLGSQSVTTILGPATLQPGEDANLLSDRLVPEVGILNVAKRITTTAGPSIRVFHGDNIQFWFSFDQMNWQLIPVNTMREFDFTNVSCGDWGSNGTNTAATAGGVPAVGGTGLFVLVAVLLSVGALIITKRRQAPVT